jgi:hypothetical protein
MIGSVKVPKEEFDAALRQMLQTPPLPLAEIKGSRAPKKARPSHRKKAKQDR